MKTPACSQAAPEGAHRAAEEVLQLAEERGINPMTSNPKHAGMPYSQAALEGAHRAAEEVLQLAEERAAAAARELATARDGALQRLRDTEAELRCALQVRLPVRAHISRV